MATDLPGYRFQDSPDDASEDPGPAVVHSVEFYPSFEDYVYIAKTHNERHASLTSWTKFTLQAFLAVNMIALPAVLLYVELPIAAALSFLLNVFFAIFFLPAVLKFDYRRYFRSLYGSDFENELVSVELTRDGIFCRHLDNYSFYSWKSVKSIEETDETIFVHLLTSSLPVRKSGFSYIEQKIRFVDFARTCHENSEVPQLPR